MSPPKNCKILQETVYKEYKFQITYLASLSYLIQLLVHVVWVYLGKGSKKKKYGNFHTFADPPPKVWKINKKKIKRPPKVQKKHGLKWLKTA